MPVESAQSTRALISGISGYRRHATVALGDGSVLKAVCQQERLTRVRGIGVEKGGFPTDALEAALRCAGCDADQVSETVFAEPALETSLPKPVQRLDHHKAHAATAFYTSPFSEATIVVCDGDAAREISVWQGRGTQLVEVDTAWHGQGFASVYSRLTRLLGFQPQMESLVEALARIDPTPDPGRAQELVTYRDGSLSVAPGFDEFVDSARGAALPERSRVAASVQRQIGVLLLEFLREAVPDAASTNLCLGGGLFYNAFLNSVVRQSGLFRSVFVPVNPGNGGIAAGCALARGYERHRRDESPSGTSPFLGPEYSNPEIKAVLDNCKLNYTFAEDGELRRHAVEALSRGEFVGWFDGRMEWGRRSLGNRSVFANPAAPYALENLNRFLKHRAAYRTYGLVARQEDCETLFDSPTPSPFMECELTLKEPERFKAILPPHATRAQVQTVGPEDATLRPLLAEFSELTGVPALVNTSFNGLHEPIVCSPHDAVRVFFGSGIDVAVLGSFLLRK